MQIIEKSKEMMTRSFEKTVYEYRPVPDMQLAEKYGIYINVPFCYSICEFCPFYKEIFRKQSTKNYVKLLVKEIQQSNISGKPQWIYIGGGTPNTLTNQELEQIVGALRKKIEINNLGIELLPTVLTKSYLDGLKKTGFSKISIGIESFSEAVNQHASRKAAQAKEMKTLIGYAKSLGFFVNTDMMIGLLGQSPETFLSDIKQLTEILPAQVTIYPYMVVKGLEKKPSMPEDQQFQWIEKAGRELRAAGYERRGPWIWSRGDDLYDSSKDELVDDYVGFGAGSFSTFGQWKVVNPVFPVYAKNLERGTPKALIAPKTSATDQWRLFARMISDLELKSSRELSFGINLYITILQVFGYGRQRKLTEKGILFAHHITKTVVESLPFPLQNPSRIANYEEYEKEKNKK